MRVLRFVWRVLVNFRRNNGLLLAGAVGYNTLLSMVPLFALVLVALSAIIDEQTLQASIAAQAGVIFPGRAEAVTEAFEAFLDQRDVVGYVGLGVMLLFSVIAFRMLEGAMRVVFRRERPPRKRHWLVSVALPFGFVGFIGIGVLLLTLVLVTFDALPGVWGAEISVPLVKFLAFAGLVLFLSALYWLLPNAGLTFRRALIGGAVAATLWEAVRSILMWYFANLSLVDVVYGSLATVVVVLLSLEVAAVIVLLGAEVLAELERRREAGVPWYQERDDSVPPGAAL